MHRYGTAEPSDLYVASDNLKRIHDLRPNDSSRPPQGSGIQVHGVSLEQEMLLFVPDSVAPLPPQVVARLAAACAGEGKGAGGLAWVDAKRVVASPHPASVRLPLSVVPPDASAIPVIVGPLMVRASLFARMGEFAADFDSFHQHVDLCLRLHRAGFECAVVPAPEVLLPRFVDPEPATPRFLRLWSSYLAALTPAFARTEEPS